jgi:hypothetical protein
MNERKTTQIIAKAIAAIIHTHPRQTMQKLSESDVKETMAEIEELGKKEAAPKYLGKRSAMVAIHAEPRHATAQVDDSILAKRAEGNPYDVDARLAVIHSKPRVCRLPELGSKENHSALRKRLEEGEK